MYRGEKARIVPVIIVLIVIALAIAGLVAAGRAIFGGNQPSTSAPTDVSRDALLNSSVGRSVRMTVRGPLVADENFRSYQITVDSSGRSMTTYSGYLAQPLGTKQLSNNVKAYEEFTHALDKANLAKGEAFSGDKDDTRGTCATGRVYEFEIMDGNNTVKRLWTSTCKGSAGSLKASVKQLEKLFHEQIPDHKAQLKNIDL